MEFKQLKKLHYTVCNVHDDLNHFCFPVSHLKNSRTTLAPSWSKFTHQAWHQVERNCGRLFNDINFDTGLFHYAQMQSN